ncbi:MAG: hypothetical protein Q8K58_16810 [Acidimicrobiales bacterium]|nr:hypothetical protein [Acidimicrobiales bacterium]
MVPAFIEDTSNSDAFIYRIPSPSGGWMLSSPEGQRGFINREHVRLNEKLRPLIRFVKLWKYCNDVPISSYYLELMTTYVMRTTGTIIYSWDLDMVFGVLYESQLRPLDNPNSVPGTVAAARAWEVEAAQKAVLRATALAGLARDKERAGNDAEASDYWDMLFGGRFPNGC